MNPPHVTITPTRRLSIGERRAFDRLVSDFNHLVSSDAEQLTQYAEAVIRYEIAAKETKRNPTVSLPVINRTTGNIVGEKIARNPAFASLKEAHSQMTSLARRLLIDAHSAEKRQKLLTKRVRAEIAAQPNAGAGEPFGLPDRANDPLMLEPDENFPGLCVPPSPIDRPRQHR